MWVGMIGGHGSWSYWTNGIWTQRSGFNRRMQIASVVANMRSRTALDRWGGILNRIQKGCCGSIWWRSQRQYMTQWEDCMKLETSVRILMSQSIKSIAWCWMLHVESLTLRRVVVTYHKHSFSTRRSEAHSEFIQSDVCSHRLCMHLIDLSEPFLGLLRQTLWPLIHADPVMISWRCSSTHP